MRTHAHGPALLLIAVLLAGCASLLPGGTTPDLIAERGLDALERGEYGAAIADLSWVATHHAERPAGRYALLALAAAELDPANPERRPDEGADHLARFRAMEDNPRWTVPVANALRGVHLELRDTEERATTAERAAAEAQQAARSASRDATQARSQHSSLGNRVAELELELAETQRQLTRARSEIERMRRTLGN
jgi:hypothetical protein